MRAIDLGARIVPAHLGQQVEQGGFELRGEIDGKVAVVTGASRGIGAATARVLAGRGARMAAKRNIRRQKM